METFAPVEFYDLTTETIPYVNFLDFQILSTGNDGIVIKLEQSPLSQHPELTIAKFYYQRKPFNLSLHETLNDIDPKGQYFAQYFPVDISTLGLSINEVNIIEMSAVDLLDNIVTLSPNYLPLDEGTSSPRGSRQPRSACIDRAYTSGSGAHTPLASAAAAAT